MRVNTSTLGIYQSLLLKIFGLPFFLPARPKWSLVNTTANSSAKRRGGEGRGREGKGRKLIEAQIKINMPT